MTGISQLTATQIVRRGKRREKEKERERERERGVKEKEAQADSLREYACCYAGIARRILTVVLAHYYGMFAIRHGHISHPGAHFDLSPARHSRNVRAVLPGDHFNYLTGNSISGISYIRDDPGIVIQVLMVL